MNRAVGLDGSRDRERCRRWCRCGSNCGSGGARWSILNPALGAGYVALFLADGALKDRQGPASGVHMGSLRWEKRGVVCHSQSLLLLVLFLRVVLLQVVLLSARAGKNSIKRRSWNSTKIDCRGGWRLLAARFWIELKSHLTTARTDEHRALRDALHFLVLLEEVAAIEFAHRAAA